MTEDELISAYVDDRLSEAERAALDVRMAQDTLLRRRVAVTRLLIREARALPALQPPRNFLLSRDGGLKQALPHSRRSSFSPWIFRLGSLAAATIFAALVAFELSRPALAPFAAAPAAVPAAPAAEMSVQGEAAPAEPMRAAVAPSPDAESGGADAAQPKAQALREPMAAAPEPQPLDAPRVTLLTPTRLVAAMALLAAIALALLGWARR